MSINCDLTPSPSTKRPSASVLLTSTVLTRSKRQDSDPQHLKETHTQSRKKPMQTWLVKEEWISYFPEYNVNMSSGLVASGPTAFSAIQNTA